MDSKKWIKNWFLFISVILIPVAIPYNILAIYLDANYENTTYSDIVERQIENNAIYGTALNQNTFSYKLELIKKIKPNIVAIGSSRVMGFRKEDFNTSFITAGGGMNYLNEGYEFLEKMYQFHKPEYIILGLDFWWFNDTLSQPLHFPYHGNSGDMMSFNKVSQILSWLINGKINISTFNNIFSNNIKNQYTNYDNLGFSAISTSTGFRDDGSYFYSQAVFGLKEHYDKKFSNTLERINSGTRKFEYGNELSKNRVDILYKILELIKKNHTKVIVFIPPVANAVYKEMKNHPYNYIDKLRKLIKSLDIENYDYHNLSAVITKNDCECIDGFHGGDVVYSRILKDFYDNNSSMSKHINIANINYNIKLYQGNALIVNKDNIFSNKEIDFLQFGCIKNKRIAL